MTMALADTNLFVRFLTESGSSGQSPTQHLFQQVQAKQVTLIWPTVVLAEVVFVLTSKRLYNVVVTNVPGPQIPLYAAGARMLEMYPVVPLVTNQALAIGLASYNGGVFYGINADRDAIPDVDLLATCIEESLAELLETVR